MDSPHVVYLNHAGTSWPKPDVVLQATQVAMECSPNHWPGLFDGSAQAIADFFHVDRERLLLSPSCTSALNLAIMELPWEAGDRVLTSQFEHHALYRNLTKLQHSGVHVETIGSGDGMLVDLGRLEAALNSSSVRLVAMTAACNVTGRMLPLREAVEMAHRAGAIVLIDGAQIAGWWNLDLPALGIDLFTFAGHKGLQAPSGIGGLYVAPGAEMACSAAVCGPAAESPDAMPGYCDVGSVNYTALAGLAAGCKWLSHPDRSNRLSEARNVAAALSEELRRNRSIQLYHDGPMKDRMPTVAFTVDGQSNAAIDCRLKEAGFIVSAGFQCAPQVHEALGTQQEGVIRVSFGPETSPDFLDRFLSSLCS